MFLAIKSLLTIGLFAGLTVEAAAQSSWSRSDALFEPWRSARSYGAHPGARARQRDPERSQRWLTVPSERFGASERAALPERLRRQEVDYPSAEAAGTIVIDTANTYLYLVLANGKALRYGIGVGREGFTWSGRERISKMAEWPDWRPPAEMLARDPDIPPFVPGGLDNPLGARALYLGNTLYRIHGTNEPASIGTFRSSGCIRMLNADVVDLYRRVAVGTEVVVLAARGGVSF